MRYRVETWDSELQDFTPQEGVACRHLTLGMLRIVMRELREYGYLARKGDSSTSIGQDTYPLAVV